MSHRKRWALILLCLIVASVLIGLQHSLTHHREVRFVDQRPVFLPNGETLKWISLGHRGLVADWLWIQCVLYYGRRMMDEDNPYYRYAVTRGTLKEEMGLIQTRGTGRADSAETGLQGELAHLLYQSESKVLVSHIYPLLDRVTTVEPEFIFPYIFGGVYVLLDTGQKDKALELLEKGYQNNPDQWQFPFYLGWIQWMYFDNKEKTVAYLQEAIRCDNCPALAGEMLLNLSENLGRKEMTEQYLISLLQSTENPKLQGQVSKLLEKLAH